MIFRNHVHLYLEKTLTENTQRTQNIALRLVIKLANKTFKLKKRWSQILPLPNGRQMEKNRSLVTYLIQHITDCNS